MNKEYSTEEILEFVKDIAQVKQDKELATYLSIEKQSIYQYKKKTQVDIQQKIICELISHIKNLEDS